MTRKLFRLSILQMLVAMAVVSVFVATNRIPVRSEIRSVDVLFFGSGMQRVDRLEYRLGWPATYYRAVAYTPVGEERLDDYAGSDGDFNAAAVAINTAIALTTLIAGVLLIGSTTRWRQREATIQ